MLDVVEQVDMVEPIAKVTAALQETLGVGSVFNIGHLQKRDSGSSFSALTRPVQFAMDMNMPRNVWCTTVPRVLYISQLHNSSPRSRYANSLGRDTAHAPRRPLLISHSPTAHRVQLEAAWVVFFCFEIDECGSEGATGFVT